MLASTDDVREAMTLFGLTHEANVTPAGLQWQRIALPDEGAVRDQDNRTMTALAVLRDVHNVIAGETRRTSAADDELADFRERHGRNRR